MDNQTKYFNFPIELLQGYLKERINCLENILYYALYFHAETKLEEGTIEDRLKDSAKFYGVSLGSTKTAKAKGAELYDSIPLGGPHVGISTDVFWNYRDNYKTEFEDMCLLAYLALRSIIQKHAMCRITNLYWLSRMDGNIKTVAAEFELSEEVQKYANEYQLNKIKFELMESWGMAYYGRYTRGFFISFKMTLEDLIYQVEKKRKSRKVKDHESKKKDALQRALARLEKSEQ